MSDDLLEQTHDPWDGHQHNRIISEAYRSEYLNEHADGDATDKTRVNKDIRFDDEKAGVLCNILSYLTSTILRSEYVPNQLAMILHAILILEDDILGHCLRLPRVSVIANR